MPVLGGGVKRMMFETTASTGDWRFPFVLIMPAMVWDSEVDEVVLGMTPDYASWDDYGWRQQTFPPATAAYHPAPFYQASSDDDDGVVTLVGDNQIDIIVPYTVMRNLGPGSVSVSVAYRNKDTDARTVLVLGRLPIVDGVI